MLSKSILSSRYEGFNVVICNTAVTDGCRQFHTPLDTRFNCLTPHVTRHTSHVTRHTSHVTRHTSHVTRHTSRVNIIRCTVKVFISRSHKSAAVKNKSKLGAAAAADNDIMMPTHLKIHEYNSRQIAQQANAAGAGGGGA